MAVAVASGNVSPLAVFRNRSFTLLWTGQFVSTIGSSLTSLAASILIYRLTNSALSVGLMLMATAAPSLILGLVAGVFVDRMDRRTIMIVADLVRAVLVFSIPFLVPLNILWLYVIVMLTSSVSQFFDPAHASVLPEITTDRELAAANSLIAISSFGSTAVGFAASGLIASQFPIAWAFYIDALTFLVSALCIGLLKLAPLTPEGTANVSGIIRNMRSGFDFLGRTPVLRSVFLISPLICLSFGMWNALLLPFARQALNATEFEYGLQEGLTSIGFVIGSMVMARVSSRLREGQWLTLCYTGMGIVGAIYATLSSVPVAIVLVMISGFLNAPSAISRGLLIQRNTPREVRGRVNSVFFVTRDISFLIGMGAAGLADVWGVRALVFLSALLALVPGALAMILPGLGQPAAEWRRLAVLLRASEGAPSAGFGRPATLADLDFLVGKVPELRSLSTPERRQFLAQSRLLEVPTGGRILSRGESSDDVYFILSGRAIADVDARSLETMHGGDFFGEIAALLGTPRTANVVADEPTRLLQIPAASFRQLIARPELSRLIHRKFAERLARTDIGELPRFSTPDQQDMKELRTVESAA